MIKKKALIFGCTGQDGSYLAEFLLSKGYTVHGVKRRASTINTYRLDHIYEDVNKKNKKFTLHYGEMTDSLNISKLIYSILPDEIYNLAAQSHVAVSFETPEYTANVDALGTLRILDVIKTLSKKKKIKFYQAGTSEMYGKVQQIPQNEQTAFYPRSPYAVSKLFSHWITINYREAYNLFCCNGILFNHESPVRGETFVTKKIVQGLCKIKLGLQNQLFLGNLYAKRDWGHAKDYVAAMWKMLQNKTPKDYVISTGKNYSVKDFINLVSKKLNLKLKWFGKGVNEYAINLENNKKIIIVKKKYFRPTEVDLLLGDSKKAHRELKWKPQITLKQLVNEMVTFELKSLNEK